LDGLTQSLPPLGGVVLETGQLIEDDHVEGQHSIELVQKPYHVLPVDDVQVGVCVESLAALSGSARDDGALDGGSVIPLRAFLRPDILCYVFRGDDQSLTDGEVIPQVVGKDGEGNDGFTGVYPTPCPTSGLLAFYP
jgi:hypothetical protein